MRGLLALLTVAMLGAGPKHVVLIVGDDVGLKFGCYGHPQAKTPNVDRLAAEGTRFTHAFCTTSSCSPSRSVILSGKHNHATGQYGLEHAKHHFRSLERLETLPALLKSAGYRTAQFGKLHVSPAETYPFDVKSPRVDHNSVALADRAGEFIKEAKDKPFLLYFCPVDAHRTAQKFANQPGTPNRFGNLPAPQQHAGVTEVRYEPTHVTLPPWLPDSTAARAEFAQYLQAVSRFDQGVGRLVQHLKDAGVYDDTLIIVTSDNGPPFQGSKTTHYEPGVRLPLVIRAPATAQRGIVCDALVSHVDLVPTILDFAEVAPKSGQFHGSSLRPLVHGQKVTGREEVYLSHSFHEVTMYYPMRTLRTRTHKLIWNLAYQLPYPSASDLWDSSTWQTAFAQGPGFRYGPRTIGAYLNRPRFELYDLEADPWEAKNLAAEPAHAGRLTDMQAKLRAWQKQTGDPWLLKWERE